MPFACAQGPADLSVSSLGSSVRSAWDHVALIGVCTASPHVGASFFWPPPCRLAPLAVAVLVATLTATLRAGILLILSRVALLLRLPLPLLPPPEPPGIESVISNDLLSSCNWRVDRVVPWRGKSHINTLELGTIGILERDLAITHPRSRFTALVDSSVAKASSAKGRSTSLALQPGLRHAAAHQIGFELYPAFGFAPTRLNIADDPTRRVSLRPPSGVALHQHLPIPVVHSLGRLRLRRPLASWARLFLVVLVARVGSSESFLSTLSGRFAPLLDTGPFCPLDFDSILGFPGEGPLLGLVPLAGLLGLGSALSFVGCFTTSWPILGPPRAFQCSRRPFSIGLFSLGFLACCGSPRVEPLFRVPPTCFACLPWITLDFDSSLGFPGEGWWLSFRVFRVFLVAAMAAPAPMTPADTERASRRAGLFLQADRVIIGPSLPRPSRRGFSTPRAGTWIL